MSILQRRRYTRRSMIRTGASLGALAALPGCLRPWWGEQLDVPSFAVDIHCHIFNAKDLPVAGFLRKWFRTNLAQLIRRAGPPDAVAEQLAEAALLPLLPVLVAFQAGVQLAAPGADEDLGAPPTSERPYTSRELAEMVRPELDRVSRAELARISADPRANARSLKVAPLVAEPALTPLAEVLTTLRVEPLSGFSKLLQTIEQDPSAAAPLGMGVLPMPRVGEEVAVATRPYDELLLKWISDRLNFFVVGTHSRRSVGREVARTYPEVELLAPALVDFDEWIDVQPALGLTRAPVTPAAQVLLLERLSRLSMEGRLTGTTGGKQRLHGYAAYCPAREVSLAGASYPKVPAAESRWAGGDATYQEETEPVTDWAQAGPEHVKPQPSFRLARYAIEHGGFIGVKLYPPVGFRPIGNEALFDAGPAQAEHWGARLDNALCRLYAWCQEKQVPVMVHCGTGNSFSLAAMDCPDPAHWADVLERYKNLRLCLGHLGHVDGLPPERPSTGYTPAQIEQSWPGKAARLMQRFENVYADVADFEMSRSEPYVKAGDIEILRYLIKTYPVFRDRLLYGSDWFLNNLNGEQDQYFKHLHSGFAAIFGEAGGYDAAAVFRGNALRFLFGKGPANLNRQRLLAYYRAAHGEAPAWLAAAT